MMYPVVSGYGGNQPRRSEYPAETPPPPPPRSWARHSHPIVASRCWRESPGVAGHLNTSLHTMAACDGCSSRIPAASADNGACLIGLASPVPSIRERRPGGITPHIPASARGVEGRDDQGRQEGDTAACDPQDSAAGNGGGPYHPRQHDARQPHDAG